MKWEGNRESGNVEDRRGGGGFSLGGGSISPATILSLLSGGSGPVPTQQTQERGPPTDRMGKFVATVLADTEDTWSEIFRAQGSTYVKPKLVLFTGATPTACGTGQTATGPFYCPGDQKVYIDLAFFRLMQERFRVSGEFAEAYVIAHEVGHHVQNLMGISGKVDSARRRASEAQGNALSVRLELQADCFAGVWAFHANQARSILEKGDVERALNAASAIGDDALQRKSQGYVVPDSFTHGSSAQRMRWFTRGIESGQVRACNTFEANQL